MEGGAIGSTNAFDAFDPRSTRGLPTTLQVRVSPGNTIEMNVLERQIVYTRAIRHFGTEHQIFKACEELTELCSALLKYNLEGHGKLNVLEEIADVTIMLGQIRSIFNADTVIDSIVNSKIERLSGRLDTAERNALTIEKACLNSEPSS